MYPGIDGNVLEPRRDHLSTPAPGNDPSGDALALRLSPVPSSGMQEVRFEIREAGKVDLAVYDVLGRRVRHLLENERQVTGEVSVMWNGRNDKGHPLPASIYFYRLVAPEGQVVKRTVLQR